MSRSDVENEIRETLGQVPSFFESMPDSTLENEWNEFKVFQLSDTALTAREKQLIGYAVAAAIHCPYCTYFHHSATKMMGTTDAAARRGQPHGQRHGQVQHVPARPPDRPRRLQARRPTRSARTSASRPPRGRLSRKLPTFAATSRPAGAAVRRAAAPRAGLSLLECARRRQVPDVVPASRGLRAVNRVA